MTEAESLRAEIRRLEEKLASLRELGSYRTYGAGSQGRYCRHSGELVLRVYEQMCIKEKGEKPTWGVYSPGRIKGESGFATQTEAMAYGDTAIVAAGWKINEE
jgi:hypothetical protein